MMRILMRGEYPFADELSRIVRGFYSVLPPGIYIGTPDAVVLYNPTPDELMLEILRRAFCHGCVKIVAVADVYKALAIRVSAPGVYTASDASSAAAALRDGRPSDRLCLTKKEALLLSEMKKGLTNKELGQSLLISERTVRRLKERLLDKTGLVSAQQLAVLSAVCDQYSQLFT